MTTPTYITGVHARVYAGLVGLLVLALTLFQLGTGPIASQAQFAQGDKVICDSSVEIDTAASGNTELVALTSGDIIYVCGYNWIAAGTVTVQLIYGTGSACGTGETDLSGEMQFTAQTGVSYGGDGRLVTKTAVSNALCVELSAAVSVDGLLTYGKY